eukprot:gene1249-15628_t
MSYPSGSGGNSQQNPFQYQMYLQQIEFECYQNGCMSLNPGNEVANEDEKKKEENNCRWSEIQARSLIKEWKENVPELESSRNRQAWTKIINNVNKNGPKKTVNQAKKKLSNLKYTYKKAKDNNKKSGATPDFPQFYNDFDEILSCRPLVKLDLVREVGVGVEEVEEGIEAEEERNQDDDVVDNGKKLAKKRKTCMENDGKKAKKVKENFKDKLLEIQERQMDAFAESDQRNREFLVELEEQQKKAAAEEKQRNR